MGFIANLERFFMLLAMSLGVMSYVSLKDTLKMEYFLENWTYGLITLGFLIFLLTLIPFVTRLNRESFRLSKRSVQAWIVGAFFSIFLFSAVKPSFKLFADESNLISVSYNLYKTKLNFTTEAQINEYGNNYVMRKVIDKRPVLFSYILSLVHTLKGYSSSNGFVLNGFICAAFAALLF